MVKIVVFDLDGTLYDSHKHIDKDTVHKIIELEQKGIVVGIVTGRFYEELGEVIKILKLREYNGFVASSNGLEIHDFLDGEMKSFTRLSKDEVKDIVKEAKKHHMISYVWQNGGIYNVWCFYLGCSQKDIFTYSFGFTLHKIITRNEI